LVQKTNEDEMKKKTEYCAWAGEKVDKKEHKEDDCICRKCDYCGKLFKNDRWVMDYTYLHKECIMKFMKKHGLIIKE